MNNLSTLYYVIFVFHDFCLFYGRFNLLFNGVHHLRLSVLLALKKCSWVSNTILYAALVYMSCDHLCSVLDDRVLHRKYNIIIVFLARKALIKATLGALGNILYETWLMPQLLEKIYISFVYFFVYLHNAQEVLVVPFLLNNKSVMHWRNFVFRSLAGLLSFGILVHNMVLLRWHT